MSARIRGRRLASTMGCNSPARPQTGSGPRAPAPTLRDRLGGAMLGESNETIGGCVAQRTWSRTTPATPFKLSAQVRRERRGREQERHRLLYQIVMIGQHAQ